MLKAIGFIALVYLALQVLGVALPDAHHLSHATGQLLSWDNPLFQLIGGIFGVLAGAVVILMVIGLVAVSLVMAAGLPFLLLLGLIALLLMPALLPVLLLAGLLALLLGGLGCVFA